MNYDPNLTNSGRMAKQTVKLTFAKWDYRAERTEEVGGNCTGISVIATAIDNLYDQLPDMPDGMGSILPGIVMVRASDGEELHCTDDEEEGDGWLKDMLVGAEITAIRADLDLYAEIAKEKNPQLSGADAS